MPTFTCSCGRTYDDDAALSGSNILFSVSDLKQLENRLASEICRFLSCPPAERERWIRDSFGPEYPPNADDAEIVEDFISRLINLSPFRSVFECPGCGRLGLSRPSPPHWIFYHAD